MCQKTALAKELASEYAAVRFSLGEWMLHLRFVKPMREFTNIDPNGDSPLLGRLMKASEGISPLPTKDLDILSSPEMLAVVLSPIIGQYLGASAEGDRRRRPPGCALATA
jgi:hypothetical protein